MVKTKLKLKVEVTAKELHDIFLCQFIHSSNPIRSLLESFVGTQYNGRSERREKVLIRQHNATTDILSINQQYRQASNGEPNSRHVSLYYKRQYKDFTVKKRTHALCREELHTRDSEQIERKIA